MRVFSKGFTVVELLVGIAIFALLSSLTIAGFRAGEATRALRDGAETAAAAVRDVEARGLSVRPGPAGSYPKGGWGIAFEAGADALTIFADGNADGIPTKGETTETVPLGVPGAVVVAGLDIPGYSRAIITTPPGQGALLINNDANFKTVTVTLLHAGSGGKKFITVNRISGLVEIQ